MFEQPFKNIDDIVHKDAGCASERVYTEQSSCLLFLKHLEHTFILGDAYRWERWAAPETADGKLSPYLAGFKQRAGDFNQYVGGQQSLS